MSLILLLTVKNFNSMIIGGIEGTDKNGKPINKIGVWTKNGFIETPIKQLFPKIKKNKKIKK